MTMKKILIIMLSLTMATGAWGCSPENPPLTTEVPDQPGENENQGGNETGAGIEDKNMVIKIGTATFTASLADNATASAFKALLPMTVNMAEHAGNEKYYGLPGSLPTSASNPGTIRNGDIMLYGNRTVVLFYKTFSTSYSYTRIGSVDNPAGLDSALGAGSVTATFEMK